MAMTKRTARQYTNELINIDSITTGQSLKKEINS